MSRFQFPYEIDLSNTKPFVLRRTKEQKFTCSGINILEYLTEEEVDNVDNIIVLGSELTWYKGAEVITPDMVWDNINFTIEEHPDREITSKNIYITRSQTPVWSFSELTSDYHHEKNQHYINVTLEEGSGEMDVLSLASGLTHLFGYFFTPHTVSQREGIYHITVSVFSADGNEHDLDVSVFNEIAKHQSEIQKPRGLWIECKVRKTEGKEENKMPAVPSQDDWDW